MGLGHHDLRRARKLRHVRASSGWAKFPALAMPLAAADHQTPTQQLGACGLLLSPLPPHFWASTPLGLFTSGPSCLWARAWGNKPRAPQAFAASPFGPLTSPASLSYRPGSRTTPASIVFPSGRGRKQRCCRANPHRGGWPDKQQWEKQATRFMQGNAGPRWQNIWSNHC